jgi:phosphohistidine phosphatase
MRHGIAIHRDDPACPPDAERALTEKGIRRTRQAVAGLLALRLRPDRVLCSPYRRAEETARLVLAGLGLAPALLHATEALLPGAAPAAIFRELAESDAREVLCCGHAPSLDEIIAAALPGRGPPFTALGKAGVAALTMATLQPPMGELTWMATPRMLRAVGKQGG